VGQQAPSTRTLFEIKQKLAPLRRGWARLLRWIRFLWHWHFVSIGYRYTPVYCSPRKLPAVPPVETVPLCFSRKIRRLQFTNISPMYRYMGTSRYIHTTVFTTETEIFQGKHYVGLQSSTTTTDLPLSGHVHCFLCHSGFAIRRWGTQLEGPCVTSKE